MIKRILLLFFMISGNLLAQEMDEGFVYLETEKYKEAVSFFENILKEYPDNRTAKLCYGRAIGLSGNSKKAIVVFETLKEKYPNDFEIKLNYAESLLWDKKYEKAELYYENLMVENPKSFSAILGYANTLSNLKKYSKALEKINNALELQQENKNALLSRKYIRLGYAATLVRNKKYAEALILLDKNLIDFPDDIDTLLNKANCYLITEEHTLAEQAYQSVATNPKDSITALLGLSLVAHKMTKNKKALEIATQAREKVKQFEDNKKLHLAVQERYAQALIWNGKFVLAIKNIDSLANVYPNEPRVMGLKATYGMNIGDFEKGIRWYEQILAKQPESFDGNLGIANAYRAIGMDMKSYEFAFRTLFYHPKQKDAERLIKSLQQSHTPFLEAKTSYTFDNGDNKALSFGLGSEVPISARFKVLVDYTFRATDNKRTQSEAKAHSLTFGSSFRLKSNISLESTIGLSSVDARTNTYLEWLGNLVIKTKPLRRQNLDIGYQRQLQNFNADLLNRRLVMNNYLLNYNLGTNFNLGWYTQLMYTAQTDQNTRNLVFTSLYYSLTKQPRIKVGVNYQYLAFKNQVSTVYFSPEQFHLTELFSEVVSDVLKKWSYKASVALGQQWVEDASASQTYRVEGALVYKPSDNFLMHLYGRYSNVASATAAGFEFTEIGLRLKWSLSSPVFNKNIMELKK